jgi:hypothetical protein
LQLTRDLWIAPGFPRPFYLTRLQLQLGRYAATILGVALNAMSWMPIRYRDFYDIPRLFLVEHAGAVYIFDCPFDDALDDYPPYYRVYRVPPELIPAADSGQWESLVRVGTFVGQIPAEVVQFDATRRAAIDDSVFATL